MHLDLPIALGMLLAYAGSVWAYFRSGPRAAYFDTLAIFVLLMLVGRWLQERVVERNRNTLLASGGIADLFTRRFEGELPRSVSASEVRAHDQLWIAPGDLVPVAGTLLRSAATLSLDWITGEAEAIELEPGSTVPAGAFNAGSRGFRLSTEEAFSASHLNDLIRERESEPNAPMRQKAGAKTGAGAWWHRLAAVYVLAVLITAVLGFLIGWRTDMRTGIEIAVAVLVVTCPCALGLGLPLGRELAHNGLRRAGVLLRRDSFLDRILQVRKVVFDKTGTITRGRLRLSQRSCQALRQLEPRMRTILQGMVSRSNHPVSRSVAAQLETMPTEDSASSRGIEELREEAGKGLVCHDEGQEYRFGRLSFVSLERVSALPQAGATTHAAFGRNGEVRTILELEEDLRRDAADEVTALTALGLDVYLYSGDHPSRVEAIGNRVGILPEHRQGGLTPESKAAAVAALDQEDTLMIGDGINDSLSFDQAFCSATPAVDRAFLPQKADFYFLGDGIGAVRQAINCARHLRSVQRGNLIFAALYNGFALTLCLTGMVSPLVAAILMPLSSVTVVLLTSKRMGGRRLRWTS